MFSKELNDIQLVVEDPLLRSVNEELFGTGEGILEIFLFNGVIPCSELKALNRDLVNFFEGMVSWGAMLGEFDRLLDVAVLLPLEKVEDIEVSLDINEEEEEIVVRSPHIAAAAVILARLFCAVAGAMCNTCGGGSGGWGTIIGGCGWN